MADYRCSFCGKGPQAARHLIVAAHPLAICDGCLIAGCELLAQEGDDEFIQRLLDTLDGVVRARQDPPPPERDVQALSAPPDYSPLPD
jgi:hypothetical protein